MPRQESASSLVMAMMSLTIDFMILFNRSLPKPMMLFLWRIKLLKILGRQKLEFSSTDDVVDFDPAPQTNRPNVADFDSHDDDVQDHITNDSIDDNDDVVGDFGEPHVLIRRFSRQCLPSTHYLSNEFLLLTSEGEPECYKETMKGEHKKFVQELIFQQQRRVVFCDSQSAIHLARILLFMVDLNILMYGIIRSVMLLTHGA